MSNSIDIRHFARVLTVWAKAPERGCRGNGGADASLSRIQLHWRPDPCGPDSHLTLEATSADGRPAIRITTSEPAPDDPRSGQRVVVPIGPRTTSDSESAPPGRDAEAMCEACGAVGTIGRAVRTHPGGEPVETHRFCNKCWPEESARYRARWTEEDRLATERFMRQRNPSGGAGPGMQFEAATWHEPLKFVREIERALRESVNLSPQDLDEIANDLRRVAPHLDGEMPWEVEAFLHRFGTSKNS